LGKLKKGLARHEKKRKKGGPRNAQKKKGSLGAQSEKGRGRETLPGGNLIQLGRAGSSRLHGKKKRTTSRVGRCQTALTDRGAKEGGSTLKHPKARVLKRAPLGTGPGKKEDLGNTPSARKKKKGSQSRVFERRT